jgi:hypothetical protein
MRSTRALLGARVRLCGLGVAVAGLWAIGLAAASPGTALASSTCNLGHGVQHVIILQFDNVHSERDNQSVPSDLEQMPALRNFITSNGTLLTDDHTVLISHTSNGIVSTETGLYPDRNGITVGNSYQYFDPNAPTNGNVGGSDFTSAFKYWTDPVATNGTDNAFNNDTAGNGGNTNTPAPWVAFTRAGCDFAGLGAANMELENTSSDLLSVFPGFNFGTLSKNATNLEGVAIHCSVADSQPGGVCGSGEADNLPSEPTGYHGFKGLFGAFQVFPVLAGSSYTGGTAPPSTVYDVFAPDATDTANSNTWGAAPITNRKALTNPPPDTFAAGTTPTSQIDDSSGNPGFPGFTGQTADFALGETAAAQEAGIPVTYTYLSDVHDDHYDANNGNAFGPGQAGDVEQLKEYNAAFQAFFQRLAGDGITKANTLFLVTVDEGDHFVGAAPTNPGCDGVTTPCNYNDIGETDVNLNGLVQGNTGDNTVFDEDFDDAPTVFVKGQPGADASNVRTLEREMSGLSEWDPVVHAPTPIAVDIADQQEEQILHMQNADPLRLPTFTMFGNPDFFFEDECTRGANPDPGCFNQNAGFAWNHGDVQPEIASTWQGWVGPGVRNLGLDASVWTDHPDARPTLLALAGLSDDYTEDGRAISQIMSGTATPAAIAADPTDYDALSSAYKQLDAPFGQFGIDSLQVSTKAVATTSQGDDTYRDWDAQLAACQAARTPLVSEIDAVLHNAAFAPGFSINPFVAQALTAQANSLTTDVSELDASATPPRELLCRGGDHRGDSSGQSGFGYFGGQPGPVGPQGPSGPQGAPGRTATITCAVKVRGNQVVSVSCRPGGSLGRSARAVLALARGKHVVGWGQGTLRHSIALHHRLRLHGRYVLTVSVVGGPRTTVRVRF